MKSSNNLWWGFILIGIGALLLLDNMRVVDVGEFLHTFWPLLLIIWGIAVIRRRTAPSEGVASHSASSQSHVVDSQSEDSAAEQLMYSNVFGDINVRVSSRSFKGGSVSAVFGDTSIDLSDAGLSEGEQSVRINGVFGDATVVLPRGVEFAVSANTLFGDVRVHDQRKEGFAPSVAYESPGYATATKRIRVQAAQVFGDVVVRN
jgi:predicted membrane protein